MTTSKRLRQLADRTGLDGFADELRAMADELDAAAQPAPVQPVAWRHPENAACVTTDPTAYARGIPLYTTPPASLEQGNWCEYVAGMVNRWVRTYEYAITKADEGRCTKSIAGIIERHLGALNRDALIDELEAEVSEQARLNGMGAERELALRAEVERLQRAIKAGKETP